MNEAKDPLTEFLTNLIRGVVRTEIEAVFSKPVPSLPKLLFSTKEAAEMLGVPETWVAARARAGEIKATRCGHYVNFTLADLQEFIDKERENGKKGN